MKTNYKNIHHSALLIVTFALLSSSYSPDAHAGYLDNFSTKVSTWVTSLWEKATGKKQANTASNDHSAQAPKTDPGQPQNKVIASNSLQTSNIRPAQAESAAAEQAQGQVVPQPTVQNIGFLRSWAQRLVRIVLPQSPSQPTTAISQIPDSDGVRRALTLAAPDLSFKSKKPLHELAKQAELTTLTAEKRARFSGFEANPDEVVKLPEKEMQIRTKIAELPNHPLTPVVALTRDTLQLVKHLFDVLWVRVADALDGIHTLAIKSKESDVRQKSHYFSGLLLEEAGAKAYASIAYAKSVNEAANLEKYTNESLVRLSGLGREQLIAKSVLQDKLLAAASASRLSTEAEGYVQLVQAELAYDRGQYPRARQIAQKVPTKSSWKEHARYLAATAAFVQKDTKENLEVAGRELTDLFKTVDSQELFDATAVTLGRIHFILGNYKAAEKYLSQVSRETNVFIEAAVDNAWALLKMGDRNHAVGNMFTLHTPYFDGAYMPESYFLQSLGYQELCQFGDAFTTVKQYKIQYADSFKKLGQFNNGGKTPDSAYYDDLVSYLSQKNTGLSGIVLREIGRHPQFIKRQKSLNSLSKDEKLVAVQFSRTAASLANTFQTTANELRLSYKKEITKFLKTRALEMEEELKFLTANMSLLEYEIYAAASNNLALQGAQNFAAAEKDDRSKTQKAKFEEDKEYWPYEDEIWEDELNHFRSKIVDGCAKAKKTS